MKMKKVLIAAALMAVGACASNTNTAQTTPQPTAPAGPTYAAGSQQDLEANAGHRIYFAYDQHSLSAEAQAVLRRQADWLNANPGVAVQLAGNCDERGTREYNLALGARRAEAAREFLVSLGVDPGRLTTISYGKERPADTGANERAWSANRNSTTTVSGVSS